jgi:hypothetical protein
MRSRTVGLLGELSMKHPYIARSFRPVRPELPPLTWPAPLDAIPPLGQSGTRRPEWADTQPLPASTDRELFEVERGTAFEESLDGLQVRELIGERLFARLFGPRAPDKT